jgi:hypothetical protein
MVYWFLDCIRLLLKYNASLVYCYDITKFIICRGEIQYMTLN